MRINREVEEYKEKHVLNLYSEHPDEIERDLNKETSSRGDYEGREVLELLQNAVDQVDHNGKIFIELKGNVLRVANTGEHFSVDGVISLMKSDLSPKRKFNDTIGQKGLGFRSLLNWSNDITIYSNELSIRFTEDYRKKYFEKIGIYTKTALLVAPKIIEPIDTEEYATVIIINISNDNQIEEVRRQLLNINKYTLLFLDKINDLIVTIDDEQTIFNREKDEEVVIITENNEEYIFNTFIETGEINNKKYNIVIAYDNEIDPEVNKLYSFFETTIDFPIKWKVHATFDLNMDRNTIKKSEENLELLEKVAKFICHNAMKIGNHNSYEGLDSLIKKSDFPATLDIKGHDFDQIYLEEMLNVKVLPGLFDDRFSLNESPVFYEETLTFFDSLNQCDILIGSEEVNRNKLLNKYCSKFGSEELAEIINNKSIHWTADEHIEVFLWWCQEFEKSNILPQLLRDRSGNWISNSDKVFLDGNVINDFPGYNWVTDLKLLSKRYQDILEKKLSKKDTYNNILGENKTRKLYNWFNRITKLSFMEQTTETIISPINASIKGDYERGKEFISWLFSCYNNPNITLDVSKINAELNLPSETGEIVKANRLYMGEVYGNSLGASLFNKEEYKELISFDKLGIDKDNIMAFKDFAKKLNVLEFPMIENIPISDKDFKRISLLPIIEGYLWKINETRNWNITSYRYDSIKDFEELIGRLETSDVIEWLLSDDNFLNQILNHQPFGKISYRVGQKWTDDVYSGISPSYIKYLLNKIPWIKFGEDKYAPNQIVFYDRLGRYVPGICGIKREKLLELGFNEELIFNLDFKTDISKLPSNKIIEILRYLDETTDPRGEISKHVYSKLLDNIENVGALNTYSIGKIKVFCKDGLFYANEDVKYAIDRPPSSDKKTHFINIAYRKNSKFIKEWFGVSTYEFDSKYKSHIVSVKCQDQYEKLERNIITTISALAKLTDDNVDKIRRIKVTHCIRVENTEGTLLEDYDYSYDESNNFFIKVRNDEFLTIISSSEYIESFVDILISRLRVNIDKDKVELYLSKNIYEQKQRLFTDYDVSWDEYYDKLWGYTSLQKKVADWFSGFIDMFNERNEYEQLKSIDFYCSELTFPQYELLRDLLSEACKDVSDLKSIVNISWKSLYIEKIKRFIIEYDNEYKLKVYNQLLYEDEIKKESYLYLIQNFVHFKPNVSQIDESIYFDYVKFIMDEFPVLKGDTVNEVDINEEYDKNVNVLLENIGIEYTDFDYFIQHHERYKSLLYFKVPCGIEDEIKAFLNKAEYHEEEPKITELQDTETSTVTLKLQEDEITKSSYNNNSELSRRDYDNHNRNNDYAGEVAEKIAYTELKKTFTDLIWHSKYSSIPSDRNNLPPNSIICDMWFRNCHGENIYFEIKSSIGEFHMSSAEYCSMKNNSEHYEVVLVNRAKSTISRHKFDELEQFKSVDAYKFRFKQVEIPSN